MAEPKRSADEIKEGVLRTAKEMLRIGLVEGTAGNLSGRLPDGNVVMTPSTLDYEEMQLEDLVVLDLDGNVLEGERSPTTEKALHLACLRAHADLGGVIHSHAMFATTPDGSFSIGVTFGFFCGFPHRAQSPHLL